MMLNDSQEGVTLLEVLLVLAIFATMIILGLRFYQVFDIDSQAAEVQYNVNELFQALGGYYKGNCRLPLGVDPSANAGLLDPTHNPPPTNPFPVTLQTLAQGGYLQNVIPDTYFAPNSIVLATAGGTSGYLTQFNLSTSTRNVYAYSPHFGDTNPSTPQPIIKTNSVYVWRAQVAIAVAPENVQTYKNLLNADCISNLSGNVVTPCANSSGEGNWLVWERLPSFASANSLSNYWPMLQNVKQFSAQFTNDDNYALNYNDPMEPGNQNYLCGG